MCSRYVYVCACVQPQLWCTCAVLLHVTCSGLAALSNVWLAKLAGPAVMSALLLAQGDCLSDAMQQRTCCIFTSSHDMPRGCLVARVLPMGLLLCCVMHSTTAGPWNMRITNGGE